jgi:outer membrane autotransporter protein
MNGFQEYSSEANLKISHDQTNSLRSTVGVKAQYEKPFTKGIRKASIEANLAWEHEYFDAQTRGINAEWVGSGVPSFQVQRGRIAPDTLISGVNLRLAVTNLLSVITGYDIEANRGYISHNFNVGVNFTF